MLGVNRHSDAKDWSSSGAISGCQRLFDSSLCLKTHNPCSAGHSDDPPEGPILKKESPCREHTMPFHYVAGGASDQPSRAAFSDWCAETVEVRTGLHQVGEI